MGGGVLPITEYEWSYSINLPNGSYVKSEWSSNLPRVWRQLYILLEKHYAPLEDSEIDQYWRESSTLFNIEYRDVQNGETSEYFHDDVPYMMVRDFLSKPIGILPENINWPDFKYFDENDDDVVNVLMAVIEDAYLNKLYVIPPNALIEFPIKPFNWLSLEEEANSVVATLYDKEGHFWSFDMTDQGAERVNINGILGEWVPLPDYNKNEPDENLITGRSYLDEDLEPYLIAEGKDPTDKEFPKYVDKLYYELLKKNDVRIKNVEVGIALLIWSIIRDFWVAEFKVQKRRAKNLRLPNPLCGKEPMEKDTVRYVYLPNIKYIKEASFSEVKKAVKDINPLARLTSVKAHVRNLPAGHEPKQWRIALAKGMGINIRDGQTYVLPHQKQGNVEKIFRSRSLLGFIYDAQVSDKNMNGKDNWKVFEDKVSEYIQTQKKWIVLNKRGRSADEGIDIDAYDERTNTVWLVQAKCWAAHRKVGPDVARDLAGAISLYQNENDWAVNVKGLIVTTSGFTNSSQFSRLGVFCQILPLSNY